MEPVEIDIRMKQNVDEESDKASKSMNSLNSDAKRVRKELQENISIQKTVLGELRSELALLEKDFNKVNVGSSDPKVNAEKKQLAAEVRNLRNEINLEETALKGLEKTYESSTKKSINLETELRNVRNEMIALKMQGQGNTQEYKELEERLGMLGTAYRELTATQQALSTGGTQMAGILSALNGVSGAFTATAGAMGLVSNSSEDMEAVQTRLQSMMAITIGLQEISNTLHETSAFRITTVTKVKELWALANLKVATTLGITNVQAQILMGTLTLGLSVAITAVVLLLDRYITKKGEAAKAEQEFNDAVSSTASTTIASYDALQASYAKLGNDLQKKKQFILENQKAFEGLGLSVLDVTDADNAFINNTDKMRQAFEERAKAAAYAELQVEKYKEKIKLQLQLEKTPEKLSRTVYNPYLKKESKIERVNPAYGEKLAEIKSLTDEITGIFSKQTESINKESDLFYQAKVENLGKYKEGTKAWWAAEKQLVEAARARLTDNDTGSDMWKALTAKIEKADAALAKFENKKTPKKDTNTKDFAKDLASLQAEIEGDMNTAILAAMEDGKAKRLLQLDQEHAERIAKITAQRKELVETEKQLGKTDPKTHKDLNDLEGKENSNYQASKDAVNKAFKDEAQKQWDELLEKYQTYENEKTAILKKYAEDRAKIEAKNSDGKYNENLKELDKAKADELFDLEKSAGGIKSTIAEIFSDLSGKSTAELDKILQKAKAVLAFLQSGNYTAEKGAEYGIDEDTFKSISADPTQLNAISGLITKLTGQTKTFKQHFATLFDKDASTEDFEKSLSSVSGKISSAIALTQMFADTLGSIAELTGSDALGEVAESFSAVADIAGSAMQGAQAGAALGPVGAAIGAGLGLVSGILAKSAAAAKAHKEALLKIQQAEIAQQRQYNALLFEQKMLMKDEESIFGVNAISKALGYLEAYKQSFAELQEQFKKQKTTYDFGFFSFDKFESELDKIELVTGHKKTGLFGWGKGKDTYSSITDEYKDLIDANGDFNLSMAESILATQTFKDGGKEALQNIIDLYKQTEEAQDNFNSYLTDTFGALGDGMIDSVVDALSTGEDAFDAFAKNVGDVMGELGKQIMYELFVSSRFKDFQEDLRKIYDSGLSPEQTAKTVQEAIGSFANNMRGDIENMQDFAQQWQEGTKDLGFDVWGSEEATRTSSSTGIAQASQDSIDDLLGRIYALVQYVNEIKEYESNSVSLQAESVGLQNMMLGQLEIIAENTAFNVHLKDIMNDIREMRERGIKIKA